MKGPALQNRGVRVLWDHRHHHYRHRCRRHHLRRHNYR